MKIMQWRTSGALLSTTILLGIVADAHPQELAQNLRGFKDPNQGLHIAKQGMFFVGGQYYTSSSDGLKYMSGQMYVEYQIPEVVTHPYPIVMIIGAAQTRTNVCAAPDGLPSCHASRTGACSRNTSSFPAGICTPSGQARAGKAIHFSISTTPRRCNIIGMASGHKPWHKGRALRCSIGSVRRSSSRTPSPELSDFSSRISGPT